MLQIDLFFAGINAGCFVLNDLDAEIKESAIIELLIFDLTKAANDEIAERAGGKNRIFFYECYFGCREQAFELFCCRCAAKPASNDDHPGARLGERLWRKRRGGRDAAKKRKSLSPVETGHWVSPAI